MELKRAHTVNQFQNQFEDEVRPAVETAETSFTINDKNLNKNTSLNFIDVSNSVVQSKVLAKMTHPNNMIVYLNAGLPI